MTCRQRIALDISDITSLQCRLPSTDRMYKACTLQTTCGQRPTLYISHVDNSCTLQSAHVSSLGASTGHSRGIEMGTSHSRQGRAAIVPLSLHTSN